MMSFFVFVVSFTMNRVVTDHSIYVFFTTSIVADRVKDHYLSIDLSVMTY